MKPIATQSPTSYCKKIMMLSFKMVPISVSMKVSRRLRFEFSLKSFRLACKPRLTAATKFKHLKFAEQNMTLR